jgi:hypothetical protein
MTNTRQRATTTTKKKDKKQARRLLPFVLYFISKHTHPPPPPPFFLQTCGKRVRPRERSVGIDFRDFIDSHIFLFHLSLFFIVLNFTPEVDAMPTPMCVHRAILSLAIDNVIMMIVLFYPFCSFGLP